MLTRHAFARNIVPSLALAAVAVGSAAAIAHEGHASAKHSKPTPEELTAFHDAKPAFERHCFRCHTAAGKKSKPKALGHMSMDGYPFQGHHADEAGRIVRKVLGADGTGKATMPADDKGAVKGDDLARILTWASAFDHAHPNGTDTTTKKEGDHHAH